MSRFRSKSARSLSLLAGSWFVFFILLTAPHLVHHAFDQSPSTVCQAFAVAKGCHIKPASVIGLFVDPFAVESAPFLLQAWIPYFSPSPFSKRAPPVA